MNITIGPADLGGCSWYRLQTPFRALCARNGWKLHIADNIQDRHLAMANLTVFQRCSTPHALSCMEAVKEHGLAKIALELDDNLRCVPPSNPSFGTFGNMREATNLLKQACGIADALFVSTQELAEVYGDWNENIYVCPNAIDDESWEAYTERVKPINEPKRLGQIRIGFAGTNSHRGDFSTIVKPLTKLMDADERVRLVFFGDDLRGLFRKHHMRMEVATPVNHEPHMEGLPSKYWGAIIPRYYQVLAELDIDIGLAPLERHLFNRGKSNLKVLEYALGCIPTVATRYGPYRDFDAEFPGSIVTVPADDDRAWIRVLTDLANDGERGSALVAACRETVAEHYILSKTLPIWQAAVESVAKVGPKIWTPA